MKSNKVKGINLKSECFAFITSAVAVLALLAFALAPAAIASSEGDVRTTVENVFQSLKNKNYEALYESLPSGSRSRITRDRFTSSLRRAQDNYELSRLDVGNIRVAGDFAVADTVLYGRLLKPVSLEGKIVVQQYLVREAGKWKVATGDKATIQKFLSANPSFARKFSIRPPRIFVKKDNSWIEFVPPKRGQ